MITDKDNDKIMSDQEFDAEWKDFVKKYGRTREERLISVIQEYLAKDESNKKKPYFKDDLHKIKA